MPVVVRRYKEGDDNGPIKPAEPEKEAPKAEGTGKLESVEKAETKEADRTQKVSRGANAACTILFKTLRWSKSSLDSSGM